MIFARLVFAVLSCGTVMASINKKLPAKRVYVAKKENSIADSTLNVHANESFPGAEPGKNIFPSEPEHVAPAEPIKPVKLVEPVEPVKPVESPEPAPKQNDEPITVDNEVELAIQLTSNKPFEPNFDQLLSSIVDSPNQRQWCSVLQKAGTMVSNETRYAASCKCVLFLERVIDQQYRRHLEGKRTLRYYVCDYDFSDSLRFALRTGRKNAFVKCVFSRIAPDTKVFLVRLLAARKLHGIKNCVKPRVPLKGVKTILNLAVKWTDQEWRTLQLSRVLLHKSALVAHRLVRRGQTEMEPVLGALYALCLIYDVRFDDRLEMGEGAWNKFMAVFGDLIPFMSVDIVNAALWSGYGK